LAEQTELVETLKSGVLGNTHGYSEYMRAFARQVLQGLWLTGFKVSGDATQVSLNGGVINPELLPVYIQHLNKETVMQGKTFSALQMKQPKSVPARMANLRLHPAMSNLPCIPMPAAGSLSEALLGDRARQNR